ETSTTQISCSSAQDDLVAAESETLTISPVIVSKARVPSGHKKSHDKPFNNLTRALLYGPKYSQLCGET
ncbi:hypothetical protein, partial [Rhizobium leguminosarum]|uniref:hypothetical protein n=1 Tax=Rhizobium leguminosarum TaxID=384 RepID=UPI003F9541E2